MTSTLSIGGIALDDWELPSKVNFGGQQQLVIHKLIGGQRVVDAMGPDPDNISWQGRFRGAGAASRALALDALRQSGAAIPLIWGGMFYMVVIQHFRGEYERDWEVPYTIDCVVTSDPLGSALGGIASTLTGLVSADLGMAANFIGGAIGDLGF